MQPSKYYKHSGAVPLTGLVTMALYGAAGALICSVIYGYADYYIPWIYLNLLLLVGFGGVVGWCVGLGGKRGQVRNPLVMAGFGLLAGGLAEYAQWVAWVFASSKQELIALTPAQLWAVIQYVDQNGAWSVFDSTPTGWELYIYWGLEAFVIAGMSALVAGLYLSTAAYCENCSRWADEKQSIKPLEPVADPKSLKSRLEQGDLSGLKTLKKLPVEAAAFTELNLKKCSACAQSNFLSLDAVTISVDKKGKKNRHTRKLLQNLVLNSDQYRTLKDAWAH